ncbi:M48 family metallopeptidase [Sulfuricurvum sp.]|uniref:M48 family metallopeptidase n=1 Tax=Sulfuricurvum sp. TaxID=2025608 RepID=UPI003BB0A315
MFNSEHSSIIIEHRPNNRNTYIHITHKGEVKVRTPLKNESSIRRILKLRERWIKAKLALMQEGDIDKPVLGEHIRFRGENHPVHQLPSLQKKIEKGKNSINIEKYYHQFYKEEAILTIPSRVAFYARKMDLHPKEIRFKRLRSRWGSCDSHGIVTFNTMMMQLTYEQIDYIIVHELAHLRHMNHSKIFHELVRTYLPEEKRLRSTLRGIRPLGH